MKNKSKLIVSIPPAVFFGAQIGGLKNLNKYHGGVEISPPSFRFWLQISCPICTCVSSVQEVRYLLSVDGASHFGSSTDPGFFFFFGPEACHVNTQQNG